MVYRNENVQTIQAQVVYENDEFVYALFKLQNGGYGFEVLSREAVVEHAQRHSTSFDGYSPRKTDVGAFV